MSSDDVVFANQVRKALIGTDDPLGAKGQTIVLLVELDFSLIEIDFAGINGGFAFEITKALYFTVGVGTTGYLLAVSI